MTRRVLHIVGSIDSEAAGPSVSVPRLAEAQARAGVEVMIATVGGPQDGPSRTVIEHRRFAHSFASLPGFSQLRLSRELHRFLRTEGPRLDIIHTHGLWLAPNVYPAAAAKRGACFVLSPRGMLGEPALQFSRFKKRLFWHVAQERALRHASLIHVTCQEEECDVRDFGIATPTAVVPNGVDIPPLLAADATAPRREVLSLGRVHPKKGLDRLINAWTKVEKDFPEWRLRIIGPSEVGHAAALQGLAAKLGCRQVSIEPPLFGEEKLGAYRSAGLFVLPTLHENFGMTVAEALAAGTPVISTKGAPWAGLDSQRAGRWIEHGPEPLVAALRELLALSDEARVQMGLRGRAWMAREFSWDTVADSLLNAYSRARTPK